MSIMYVAACEPEGGIYSYKLGEKPELIEFVPLDSPMYLAVENEKMYVVQRKPLENSEFSGVVTYDIAEGGKLVNKSEPVLTGGVVGCHMAVQDGDVYCANYVSGNAVKLPDKLAIHSGKGPNQKRQDGPHTHQVTVTPDGKFVCVTDLGLDKIMVYDREMNLVSEASVPLGHGARHIVFSNSGKYVYCVNEMEATVSSFKYNDGKLEYIKTIEGLLPEQKTGNTAAAIRISADDKYLYTTNRGHNSVSCFTVNGGELSLFDNVPCGGDFPRDMNITNDGKLMICTNEKSNDLTFLDVLPDGKLRLKNLKISVLHPLCVIFY